MNSCPECGVHLPDGMTCRDRFLHVKEQEYQVMSLRRDYLAAQKLTELNYLLQHPNQYSRKELSLASRMLTLILCEGFFPLDAAEIVDTPFSRYSPVFDQLNFQQFPTRYPLNIGNFRNQNESYLESAYRWSRSVLNYLAGSFVVNSATLELSCCP